ncbi:Hydrolase, partial [Dysosmobacter welbionis]
GQQEELSHLGREREVQHAFLTCDLLLRGGRLDLVRWLQRLCQRLGELGVTAKQLRIVGLEFLLLFPLYSLLLLAESVQLRQIPLLVEIADLKCCAALFQNGDGSLLAGQHRDPSEVMPARFQFQKFASAQQVFQLRLMLVPPAPPAFGSFPSLGQVQEFYCQYFTIHRSILRFKGCRNPVNPTRSTRQWTAAGHP